MELHKDKTSVLILTHHMFRSENGEDTDQRIISYLKDKVKRIVYITNPFPYGTSQKSYFTLYENGKKVILEERHTPKLPQFFKYLYNVLFIYDCLRKYKFRYDLCLALESLSFFVIFPLKVLRLYTKIVYYSFDTVPRRFENNLLNWLYLLIYRFSFRHSDRNWVMAKEQIEGNKLLGIDPDKASPFSLVPIGYDTKKIRLQPIDKINYYHIVYAGALRESYGPQLAVKVMPLLIEKFPKIQLTIIGKGYFEGELKRMIRELKINQHVIFRGYVSNFQNLTNILTKKSIGLAPYAPIAGSNSYYSDPSKIKLYLCCGLPVITTNVTTMRSVLSQTQSGVVINFSEEEMFKAISDLLTNKKKYQFAKLSAIQLSKTFDMNSIMDTAIKEIPTS